MEAPKTNEKPGETRFKYELDNVLGAIADDLNILANGGVISELKIMDLDERIYGRLMNFINPPEITTIAKAKKAEEAEVVKKPNIQDAVLKKQNAKK